ncbi:hypothetical protein Tco_1035904 [Tanacetum coccineum]
MKIHHRVQGSGKKAIIEVMVSLEKNQTCSLVRLRAGKKASQRLWMFKVKEEQDGSKSFMQKDKVRVICHEPMLLLKEDGSSCIRQLLNVDDMLVAGSNMLPLVFEMKDRCSKKQVLGYVLTVGITTSEWESGLQKSITIDVHQVGDEIEVKVLHSFNWPSCELITEDGVLPERVQRVPYVRRIRCIESLLALRLVSAACSVCLAIQKGLSSSIVKGKVVRILQRLLETESSEVISLQVGDC